MSAMRQAVVRGTIASLVACALVVCASPALAVQKCSTPPGDVTGDGVTDILDIQCAILTVLSSLSGAGDPTCLNVPSEDGDLNCDGTPDIVDIVVGINLALGIPLADQVDGDQDGCPNGCEDIAIVLKRVAPVTTIGTATGTGFSIRGLGQSGSTAGKATSGTTAVGAGAVGVQP